jgi:hypothetical protein
LTVQLPAVKSPSPLDRRICHVVNCLMCFGAGLSAFCLKKKEKACETCSHFLPSKVNGSLSFIHFMFTLKVNLILHLALYSLYLNSKLNHVGLFPRKEKVSSPLLLFFLLSPSTFNFPSF